MTTVPKVRLVSFTPVAHPARSKAAISAAAPGQRGCHLPLSRAVVMVGGMSRMIFSKKGNLAALFVAIPVFCQAADPAPPMNPGTTATHTNALAREKSPYLLQHQHNPVEWYPWGAEAFEKARSEEKPIFLSVGYSTCHWCHVMAHESFENEEIAKLMNQYFINIKVDREERPDVDRVYMTYVQATTGGGGWPMSVFLTPDLKPFLGGTYYPPEDRYGRPGFPTVLKRIGEAWKNDRAGILEHGETVIQQLKEYSGAAAPTASAPGAKAVSAGYDQLTRTFDSELGGFGDAPKFPRPVALNLLFRVYAREKRAAKEGPLSRDGKAALGIALLTLRKMADGGMHDHLGGGFHRYSVDKFWHIPHFEKMLYDQAQLACSYLDAFQATREPAYERIARDILDYVRRDMTHPEGGFYSAEDADSIIAHGKPEHAEGAFYVWTKAEIDALLDEETASLFNRFYGVEEGGNAPAGSDPQKEFTGKNTLIQRMSVVDAAKFFRKSEAEIEAALGGARSKLLEARAKRPRPHLDDKIITAWNGLMISAFARAAQVLDDPKYLESAQRAVLFLEKNLTDATGNLLRSHREEPSSIAGFADDYAFFIQALLDLYEADFDIAHLQLAARLQKVMDARFGDPEHGGYFGVSGEDKTILLRMKEDYDGAEPSPNSIAAQNLLRLAQLTNDDGTRAQALKTIGAFADQLARVPSAMPQMLVALEASMAKPRQIVIAGSRDAVDTRALLREIHEAFLPDKLVLLADGAEGQRWLGEKLEFFQTVSPIDGKAAAYVCEDFVCQLPTNDAAQLRELLGFGK